MTSIITDCRTSRQRRCLPIPYHPVQNHHHPSADLQSRDPQPPAGQTVNKLCSLQLHKDYPPRLPAQIRETWNTAMSLPLSIFKTPSSISLPLSLTNDKGSDGEESKRKSRHWIHLDLLSPETLNCPSCECRLHIPRRLNQTSPPHQQVNPRVPHQRLEVWSSTADMHERCCRSLRTHNCRPRRR